MILDAIIGLVVTLLTGLLGMIPAYSLPDSILSAGATIGETVGTINGVVPIVTMGACLAALIGVRMFIWIWQLVVFIYDKIPAKAT